jgi:Tol biopolymer transport system component
MSTRHRAARPLALLAALAASLAATQARIAADDDEPRFELVSRNDDGAQGNNDSDRASISADGRVVAFDSGAGNLVAGDGDDAFDVFVHDRRTRNTEGISTRRPTDIFTGQSLLSSISEDGRFVGFESNDPTLARDDTNGFFSDAFLFDRERRRLRLVSRNRDGEVGNDDGFGALVSDDGRFVVFSSRASNLVRGDTNQSADVFRRDLEEGKTERLAADDTSADLPFGFEVVATDITPRARRAALLTRADLAPEQDVGSFVADVYVADTHDR